MKLIEFTTFLVGWVGMCCCVVEYELNYNLNLEGKLTDSVETKLSFILWINVICNFVTGLQITMRYKLNIKRMYKENIYTKEDSYLSIPEFKAFFLEIVLILISPYPFFRSTILKESY